MKFGCPRCNQRISIREKYAGATVDCPDCGAELIVPAPDVLPLAMDAETLAKTKPVKSAEALSEDVGTVIGNYLLVEKIGEGGFGKVFLAEQTEPFKRTVALKVIKAGMDSEEVIRRFEAERQTLAIMQHHNIAQVYDAGTTVRGRPYFVMEYVDGEPITKYCDRKRFSTKQRVSLFITVCQAVQHAHQKGIIHRDLKPSNILVTEVDGKPQPKVIDFGIAKAIRSQSSSDTMFTLKGEIVGTPEYMSPEQASGGELTVDTTSDVYSLGVIFYELLTGRTPIDSRQLRKAGIAEMIRMIVEVEPPKPSTRISAMGQELFQIARDRNIPPNKLRRMIWGDLDWIVMKALEKQQTRRYPTAYSFAIDLRRFLENEPVAAGPPSKWYRFQKFARRYRTPLAAAGLSLLVLISALGFSISQAVLAREARDAEMQQRKLAEKATANESKQRKLAESKGLEAQKAADEAQAVLLFFEDTVLAAARPKGQDGGLGVEVTLREAINAAELQVERAFKEQPTVEASIRATIGITYSNLGNVAGAILQDERALELRKTMLGPEHPGTLHSMNNLANSYGDAGREAEALTLKEKTLELRKKVLDLEHPDTLSSMNSLANSYSSAGRDDEARALRETVLKLRKKMLGPEHPDTLASMNNLANSHSIAGRDGEARALRETVLKLRKKMLGPEHPDTLSSMYNLALSISAAGHDDEARALREKVLKLRKKVLGPEHPNTLSSMNNLAISYNTAGRDDEALVLREKALKLRKKILGPEHPDTLISMHDVAFSYGVAGQDEEALDLYKETLKIWKKILGPGHSSTLDTMYNLAGKYEWMDQLINAEALYRDYIAVRKKQGADDLYFFKAQSALGNLLTKREQYTEAEILLQAAQAGLEANSRKEDFHGLKNCMKNLVTLYKNWSKPDKAALWQTKLEALEPNDSN